MTTLKKCGRLVCHTFDVSRVVVFLSHVSGFDVCTCTMSTCMYVCVNKMRRFSRVSEHSNMNSPLDDSIATGPVADFMRPLNGTIFLPLAFVPSNAMLHTKFSGV